MKLPLVQTKKSISHKKRLSYQKSNLRDSERGRNHMQSQRSTNTSRSRVKTHFREDQGISRMLIFKKKKRMKRKGQTKKQEKGEFQDFQSNGGAVNAMLPSSHGHVRTTTISQNIHHSEPPTDQTNRSPITKDVKPPLQD